MQGRVIARSDLARRLASVVDRLGLEPKPGSSKRFLDARFTEWLVEPFRLVSSRSGSRDAGGRFNLVLGAAARSPYCLQAADQAG